MRFIGGRLGRQWGRLDKEENRETPFFYVGGFSVVCIYSTERWCSGNKVTTRVLCSLPWCGRCALRAWRRRLL